MTWEQDGGNRQGTDCRDLEPSAYATVSRVICSCDDGGPVLATGWTRNQGRKRPRRHEQRFLGTLSDGARRGVRKWPKTTRHCLSCLTDYQQCPLLTSPLTRVRQMK